MKYAIISNTVYIRGLCLGLAGGLCLSFAGTTTAQQARESQTSHQDKAITNSCIASGQSKSNCLCVVSILKHDMSLREYRAAAMLYEAETSGEPRALTATKMSLRQQGYSDDEIRATDQLRRNLLIPAERKRKCDVANVYFAGTED